MDKGLATVEREGFRAERFIVLVHFVDRNVVIIPDRGGLFGVGNCDGFFAIDRHVIGGRGHKYALCELFIVRCCDLDRIFRC